MKYIKAVFGLTYALSVNNMDKVIYWCEKLIDMVVENISISTIEQEIAADYCDILLEEFEDDIDNEIDWKDCI